MLKNKIKASCLQQAFTALRLKPSGFLRKYVLVRCTHTAMVIRCGVTARCGRKRGDAERATTLKLSNSVIFLGRSIFLLKLRTLSTQVIKPLPIMPKISGHKSKKEDLKTLIKYTDCNPKHLPYIFYLNKQLLLMLIACM